MFVYRCLRRRGSGDLRLVVSRGAIKLPGYTLRQGTVTNGDSVEQDPADLALRLFWDLGGRTGAVDAARCEVVERDGSSVGVVVSALPAVTYALEFERVGAVGGSRMEHLRALEGFLESVIQKA